LKNIIGIELPFASFKVARVNSNGQFSVADGRTANLMITSMSSPSFVNDGPQALPNRTTQFSIGIEITHPTTVTAGGPYRDGQQGHNW